MKVFIDLKWFFKQEKRPYIVGILLLIVVAMLELVPPKIIGIIVDAIKEGTLTGSQLLKWVIVLAVTAISMYVVRYFWRLMIFGSAYKLARQLRDMLYSHFTKMSQTFYQKKRVGDLMAHATNDLQAIQQTAGAGVLTMVDSLTIGIAVVVVMRYDKLGINADLLNPHATNGDYDKLVWSFASSTVLQGARSLFVFERQNAGEYYRN